MATASMATAAGAAALLYYTLNKKIQSSPEVGDDEENGNLHSHAPLGIDRVSHRLIQAPATWLETISTLAETLRFTYSETLGKWPIGDLAFGITFLLKRQVCAGQWLICYQLNYIYVSTYNFFSFLKCCCISRNLVWPTIIKSLTCLLI